MTTPSFFGYLLSPKIIAETTWEVLGNFERVTIPDPATSKIFPISPAIDFDNVSMLVLTFDGSFSAGGTLIVGINDLGSTYNTYGRRIIGGVETLINIQNTNGHRLATGSLITGANDIIQAICYIQLNKAGLFDETGFQSVANGVSVNGNEVFSGAQNSSISSINEVRIQLTAGGWNVGTRITLYKVSR